MRISEQQIIALTQYDMNAAYESMAQAQTTLATGKTINTPSDNPIGAAVALQLQGHIDQNTGFEQTASDSLGWLQATDAGLSGVNDVVLQARTLAVQGVNGALTNSQRKDIVANVDQLIQQAMQSANGTYGQRYVLGGFASDKPPFIGGQNGAVPTFQGDPNGQINREVAPGQTMQVNTTGDVLNPVFQALTQIRNDLQSGNTAALGGADLQQIDSAHDGLLMAQTTVGARINRVQAVQDTLQMAGLNLSGQLSQTVGADFAQASVTFAERQATYQAALTVASKVIQPSLLEFLH